MLDHLTPMHVERLSFGAISLGIAVNVCIASGTVASSVAIYALSVAAAALTLRGVGWRLSFAGGASVERRLSRQTHHRADPDRIG
jgi:uncharacterized protein (DUF58 family)